MELILERTYHPDGTNGQLTWKSSFLCYTIELPWLQNRKKVSCIPEGSYRLQPASSRRLGQVLNLGSVPGRSGILIHPANQALRELKGCIAPVLSLDGPGRGGFSKAALQQLLLLIQPAWKQGEQITLTIKKQSV